MVPGAFASAASHASPASCAATFNASHAKILLAALGPTGAEAAARSGKFEGGSFVFVVAALRYCRVPGVKETNCHNLREARYLACGATT